MRGEDAARDTSSSDLLGCGAALGRGANGRVGVGVRDGRNRRSARQLHERVPLEPHGRFLLLVVFVVDGAVASRGSPADFVVAVVAARRRRPFPCRLATPRDRRGTPTGPSSYRSHPESPPMDTSDVTCAILAAFRRRARRASRALRVILRVLQRLGRGAWNTVPTGLYAMAFR